MYKFSTLLILVSFFTKIVSAQFPLPYCTENFPSAVEPITSVTFANISQTSSAVVNGTPDHEDFTSIDGFVVPGGTYTITVKGNTNGNFLTLVRLYIDWNDDNDFLDAGEAYPLPSITNSTGTDAIVSTASIIIPGNASVGSHRMRISKKRNTTPIQCSTTGFGQAEDYNLKVFSLAPYCNNHYPVSIAPISQVVFGTINNSSNANINATSPHQDFTNKKTLVIKDSTYNLRVEGNTGGGGTHYVRAFIDWNNDHDLEDANESYDIGTITNSTGIDGINATAAITIPANVAAGIKRLRITKKSVDFALSCDSANRGQSEDYTIQVVDNIRAVIDDQNTFLKGDYVEVGINRCGSWGTFDKAPVEYHARSGISVVATGNDMLNLGFVADPEKNGWAVGNPNLYNGDYFLPQVPYVGWGIFINGAVYGSDRSYSSTTICDNLPAGSSIMFPSAISININGTKASGTWQGFGGGLLFKKITTVKQDKVYFTVQIKLYNTTASTISNIYYGEYVNPDPDYFFNGGIVDVYNINNIIFQNPASGKSLIQSIGVGGMHSYIGLGSKDCRSKVLRGTGGAVQPGGFPNNWYLGGGGALTGGDPGSDNHFIGISFDVGSILPGDSTTFTYAYILKAEDYNDALDETDPTFISNGITVSAGGTLTPCANTTSTVKLNDADAYTWTWSPATGLNTTIGKQVDITVTTTPITYTLTGVALNGCADKIITLQVDPVNISNIATPGSITKCADDPPVLLSATGGNFSNAVIYSEGFNSEGDTWNKFNNSIAGATANAAFTLRPNSYFYPPTGVTFNSNDNSQFYLSNSHSQTSGTTATLLQSQAFSTLNYTAANISFYHFFRQLLTSSTATVQISNNGTSWTNLQSFTTTQGAANNFAVVNIAVPPAFIDQPTVYIRFKYDAAPIGFYWAIDNIKVTASGQPITWAPLTNLFTDAAGTTAYTGGVATNVYANPANTRLYTASASTGICTKTSTSNVIVNPLSTTLAGIAGATVCQSKLIDTAGSVFNNSSCDPIAKVKPAGANPVAGQINTCVYIDPAIVPFYNAEPYLQRHIDILPATNASTSTGRVTLYFTDAEFETYNANNVVWPDLPTLAGGANTDARRSNLRITQYHGTPNTNPSHPNNYSMSTGLYINPVDSDIFWNGNYWEVSFDVSGFSGFYIHTNLNYPLPVNINYLNGKKQGNAHLLEWKVTCNSTPKVTLVLERSADSRIFNDINTIHATAAQCTQSFNYTDADPLQGINYYRLKTIDANGKVSYSNIIALLNAATGIYITGIAPNPINKDGSFKLNITSTKPDKLEMVITDMQGRLVQKQFITIAAGYSAVSILMPALAAGTYTIGGTNTAGDKTKPIRFIKQ